MQHQRQQLGLTDTGQQLDSLQQIDLVPPPARAGQAERSTGCSGSPAIERSTARPGCKRPAARRPAATRPGTGPSATPAAAARPHGGHRPAARQPATARTGATRRRPRRPRQHLRQPLGRDRTQQLDHHPPRTGSLSSPTTCPNLPRPTARPGAALAAATRPRWSASSRPGNAVRRPATRPLGRRRRPSAAPAAAVRRPTAQPRSPQPVDRRWCRGSDAQPTLGSWLCALIHAGPP